MTIADELARLQELRDSGALTEAEFEEAKRKALDEQPQPAAGGYGAGAVGSGPHSGQVLGVNEEMYCTLMHLSQLLVYSGLGIIVPIAMWLIGKEDSELVRRHGNRMMNWFISSLIYALVCGVLVFAVIGIPLLIVLAILEIVLPIMAAIKCANGEVWSYPMAMRFFDED